MFSGIIEVLAKPTLFEKSAKSIIASFGIPKGWDVVEGESIIFDGICSTVTKVSKNSFTVYWMQETLSKTHLLSISKDHKFNLERCLTLQKLIGGHLVMGHVDTTGEVLEIKKVGEDMILKIGLGSSFTRYIIYKGSIAVNGVSLTIVSVSKNAFTVSLIPYTQAHTNLGSLKKGDRVNIEVDMIAKYLEKLAKK